MTPTHHVAIQNAWVVTDIEKSARRWSKAMNIGPFNIAEYKPDMFEDLLYRGKPAKLHMKTAIAYAGEVQIELVEPIGVYPCAYFDTIAEGMSGFHHLCYWSNDIEADLNHYLEQGFSIANQGQMAGGGPKFAYVDASESLGCMLELLEYNEEVAALFEQWKNDGKNWQAGNEAVVHL